MSTNRRTSKVAKTIQDEFGPIAKKRGHRQTDLFTRWLVEAYHRAQAGKSLPPAAGISAPVTINMLWTQDKAEFDTIAAALASAESSVRAVLEHCIRWYIARDGDLLADPQSPFDRSRGRKN